MLAFLHKFGTIVYDFFQKSKIFKTKNTEVKEGDIITIDGSSGRVIFGEVKTVKPEISGDFSKIMISSA